MVGFTTLGVLPAALGPGGIALYPVNTVVPVISGTPQVGSALTTTNGTWTNSPTAYAYQWKSNGTNVGTNANSYTPVTGDIGNTITVTVTATNANPGSGQATSLATAAVTAAAATVPVNSVAPAVSGTAQVGQTLTSTTGTWSNSPTGYAYQWKSNGTNVGTNQNTYVPVTGDIGNTITCTVTASNASGAGAPVTSAATSAVIAAGSSSSAFTSTQLPQSANYQRLTTTGGSTGKGAATIPVRMSAVTTAGAVYARLRDTTTLSVVQPSWAAATMVTTGAQTVNITGVECDLREVFLDLSGDGTTFVNGTTPITIGDNTHAEGQSYVALMITPNATGDQTMAGAGITAAQFTKAWGKNSGVPTAWLQYTTGGSFFNAAGGAQFLNMMVAAQGVPQGLLIYGVGGTAIETWWNGSSQVNYTAAMAQFDAAYGDPTIYGPSAGGTKVGARFLVTEIGHSNATGGAGITVDPVQFGSYNAGWIDDFNANHNAYSSPKVMVGTVPGAPAGAAAIVTTTAVRRGAVDLASARSYSVMSMSDSINTPLQPSGTDSGGSHLTVQGGINQGQSWARALLGTLDAAPKFAETMTYSASAGVATLTVPVTVEAGKTLSIVGDPSGYIRIYKYGEFFPTRSIAVNAGSMTVVGNAAISFTIPDPGNVPLAMFYGDYVGNEAGGPLDSVANGVFDNDTRFGVTRGRSIQINPRPAKYKPSSVTLTGLLTPAYSGSGPFSGTTALTTGVALLPYPIIPSLITGGTVEFWMNAAANPASIASIAGHSASNFTIQHNTDGTLNMVIGGQTTNATTLTVPVAQWVHISVNFTPLLQQITIYINGALALTKSTTTVSAYGFVASSTTSGIYGGWAIRGSANGTGGTGGTRTAAAVADFYITEKMLRTGAFTPPTAAFTGTETGFLGGTHLNGDMTWIAGAGL